MIETRTSPRPPSDALPAMAPSRAIGTKEAATLLGVCRNTLYTWVHSGKVPHRRVGSRILFSSKVLEAWIDGADIASLKAQVAR